jgi:hypothetical protein
MRSPGHAGATHEDGFQCAGAALGVLLKVESETFFLVKLSPVAMDGKFCSRRQRLVGTTVTPETVSKKARRLSLTGADMA